MTDNGKSGSEGESQYSRLIDWIGAPALSDSDVGIPSADDEQHLAALLGEDAHCIARDRDGVLDSAQLIVTAISNLLSLDPNSDQLETVLVEVETNLEHAVKHYLETLKVLADRAEWPANEFFDRI